MWCIYSTDIWNVSTCMYHVPYILVNIDQNRNITQLGKKPALIYIVSGGIETHVTKWGLK